MTTPLFNVVNDVVLTDSGDTLYQISSSNGETTISLVDYKIEDVLSFYYITTNTNDSYATYVEDLAAGISDGSIEAKTIDSSSLFVASTDQETTYYSYFAMELPSTVSNYYAHQKLVIGSLRIDLA